MPHFKPTNPNEFSSIIPDGDYLFEVRKAEEGIGKDSGNPYLKLTLSIFHGEKEIIVTDYLSFGESSHKKLWGFCQSVLLENAYHDGEIDVHIVLHKSGRLHLTSQQNEGYEAKNVVAFYKKQKKEDSAPLPAQQTGKLKSADDSDFIPF